SGTRFSAVGDRPLPGRDRYQSVSRPAVRFRLTGVLPPAGRGRRPGVRLGPLLLGRLLAEAARQERVRGVSGFGQGWRGESPGREGSGVPLRQGDHGREGCVASRGESAVKRDRYSTETPWEPVVGYFRPLRA